MKFIGLMLSSLILLALFAANAQAVQDAGSVSVEPGRSLADKLIEESNTGSVYANNNGFAPTPQAQRKLNENKTDMDWTVPSTLTGSGNTPKASRTSSELDSSQTTAETAPEEIAPVANTSAAIDTELPPAQPEVVTAGGNWYFTLNDSVERDMSLSLFQKGNDVFGAGKIKEGNNTQDVTVSGTVADATLELDVVSMNPISRYNLKLDLSGDYATGEYLAFSTSGDTWTGSAEGEKAA
ncbi:MAG: hypothetical protein WCG94_03075 [Methanothrix sp.]